MSFNAPSWSISTEFYVYILFAFVVLLLFRKNWVLWESLAICLGAMTALALFDPMMDLTFDFGWVRGLAGFFAGVLTFTAYRKLHLRTGSADLGFVALGALAVLGTFVIFKPPGHYVNMAIVPFSAVLILLLALSSSTGAARVLGSGPLRWLGAVSYSIYMVHAAVGFALGYLVKAIVSSPPTPSVQMGLALLNIAIVVTVASGTFLWIEMPIRAWSRKPR